MYTTLQPGLLLLEDGSVFEGEAVAPGTRFSEVVFNTSMTGYQEVLTDPSYRGQIVVMTQPHIGNYGTTPEVAESSKPWVEGFIARQFTRRPSGVGGDESLVTYLRRHEVPAGQVAPGGRVALAGAGHPGTDGGLQVLLTGHGDSSGGCGSRPHASPDPAATKETSTGQVHPEDLIPSALASPVAWATGQRVWRGVRRGRC